MKCVWWRYLLEEYARPDGGVWRHRVLPDAEADELAQRYREWTPQVVLEVKVTMPHDCPGDDTCEAWKWRKLHLKIV